MKKYLYFLAGTLIFCFSTCNLFAEDLKLSGSLDVGYYSRYVCSGVTLYNDHVFQQSIGVRIEPLGLYTRIWSSYSPKGGFNSDFGDEIDYIIGIYRIFKGVGIDISYSFYNMFNVENTAGDLHALVLRLDLLEVFSIKPYIRLEENIPVDRNILEGGFIYELGIKYDINLLKFNVSIKGHDGAYRARPELVSSTELAISSNFKIKKVNISPTINLQKRLGYKVRNGGIAEDKIWYGINFSIPF